MYALEVRAAQQQGRVEVETCEADLAVGVPLGDGGGWDGEQVRVESTPSGPGDGSGDQAMGMGDLKVGGMADEESVGAQETEDALAQSEMGVGVGFNFEVLVPERVVQEVRGERLDVDAVVDPDKMQLWVFGDDDVSPFQPLSVEG